MGPGEICAPGKAVTMRPLLICTLLLAAVAGSHGSSSSAILPADTATCKASFGDTSTQDTVIRANDNRFPAGHRAAQTLRLSIIATFGAWYPDQSERRAIPMQAFGECGRPLQIPGPLIRVPAHTQVVVLVHNAFSRPLVLHGLVDRPSKVDREIVIAPNSEQAISFQLNTPGTYLYWGTTTGSTIVNRLREDSQLSGAIVVDPEAGAHNDRVFVIGRWVNVNHPDGTPDLDYELNVINGRTWPYTERLTYAKNSLVHWRWINASGKFHPLHLHGFYFHIDSRGDGISETPYTGVQRDMEVTELVSPGATYSMTWKAARPGNWLFHCHLIYHVIGHVPIGEMLDEHRTTIDPERYDNDLVRKLGMGGLTLGVTVSGKTPVVSAAVGRRVSVVVEPAANDLPGAPSYRYVIKGSEVPTDLRAANGPPILLTQGVPVAIDVTNHLDVPTQVHWHGMELTDSYYDGVAGFSGSGKRLTPMIMPGQTFEARFTPPRAGTFIYHAHMDDVWQLRAGLAGPLVVLEPRARFDSANDHIILLGTPHAFADRYGVLVNSATIPADLTFHVGVKQRLRFINITTFRPSLSVSLTENGGPVLWEPLARDGAQLPKERQDPQTAVQLISIGQTRDFIFTPHVKTALQLQITTGPPFPHVLTVSVHVI